MLGLFITFEGGEGAGKSTQIKRLAEHMRASGRDVVLTREPGGTAAAEDIRALLVNGETARYSTTAEALLNYAARDCHLREVIRPALATGKTVLCDRFMDSTRVYQNECPDELLAALEEQVVGNTKPDLTFMFDLDPVVGLARASLRGAGVEDRYERKGLAFHQKLREGFLAIARDEPIRCVIVDASGTGDEVWAQIIESMKRHGHI